MSYKLTFTCALCSRKNTVTLATKDVWPTICTSCNDKAGKQ